MENMEAPSTCAGSTRAAIRCSSVDRVMACPGSRLPASVPIQTEGLPSKIGTAVHRIMAAAVRGEWSSIPDDAVRIACADLGILDSEADVRRLSWSCLRVWQIIGPDLHPEWIEERRELPPLAGTCDMAGFTADHSPFVLDWKTGSPDASHWQQLMAYGHVMGFDSGKLIIVWAATETWEVRDYGVDDMASFVQRLDEALHSKAVRPGQHCTYCPKRGECAERAAYIGAAQTAIMGVKEELPEKALGKLYYQAKQLESALHQYWEQLKAELANGPLDMGEGKELAMEESPMEKLNGVAVAELAAQGLTVPPELISVGKGDIIDIVSAQAPRGKKKEAKEAFLQTLREKGGIKVTTRRTMTVRDKAKKEEGKA